MRTTMLTCIVTMVLAAPAYSQGLAGPGPSTMPTSRPTSQPTTRYASPFHHMKVDVKKRTIVMEAEVSRREGPLELILCRWDTKDYESILHTRADASGLHAALMLMNLTPGKPARANYDPTTGKSTLTPPKGPEVTVSFRWKDKDGKVHQASAADWLDISTTSKTKPAPPKTFVFVGSDLTSDGQYWADGQGDYITLSNFPSSTIDVPFESTSDNASLDYSCKAAAIPEIGTAVEVVIQPVEGAEKAADARVIVEIDRFGRYSVDGKEIRIGDMRAWAEEYLEQHSKGEVTLRVDGRALAYDIRRAQMELKLGGIFDTAQVLLDPPIEQMPRTAQEARQSLKAWQERFEHTDQFIREPTSEARAMLEHIRAQIRNLDEVKMLWSDYERGFEEAFRKYQASTQPATASQPESKQ